jgi:hypothetical protein
MRKLRLLELDNGSEDLPTLPSSPLRGEDFHAESVGTHPDLHQFSKLMLQIFTPPNIPL